MTGAPAFQCRICGAPAGRSPVCSTCANEALRAASIEGQHDMTDAACGFEWKHRYSGVSPHVCVLYAGHDERHLCECEEDDDA